MTTHALVLNGGSSAGVTSLARALQDVLPRPWLTFGVDAFVETLPPALTSAPDGLNVAPDGAVTVGPVFHRLEAAWRQGVAAIARTGTGVIIDDVFLGGAAGQQRWQAALDGLNVLWVGVHCAPEVAAARERARGDRVPGMAAAQAERVHRGVRYDLTVDTGRLDAGACAARIAAHVVG
ncbi:chloramphenicol phosphotransferase CPT [Streptomyces sp. S186]|uniref:chloramphenicol phosphotransferase CPT n=1 Tax=Streptomyces sp. S186 TaxID=3434395 RepID=UPI003F66A354